MMGGRGGITNDSISLARLEIIFPLMQQILQFLALFIYISTAICCILTPPEGEILDVEPFSAVAR